MADERRSIRAARRCRRTACRAPTCTPSSSRPPRPAAPMQDTTGTPKRRSRRRCCFRCPPPRPTNCAAPLAGWPTGSATTTAFRCPTSPTRWRAGAHTVRCAPPWSRAPSRSSSRRLREVAEGDTSYEPAVGRDDRGPVWVFSGQGSQWAAMGAELLATEPVFAATVAQIEPVIAASAASR